jgi:hypothetical protein
LTVPQQQTITNEDQSKEVEERVQWLGGTLTYPVGDQDSEEEAREGALKKFVLQVFESLGLSYRVQK